MATMVAQGNSSQVSPVALQENGSRNKRKFRADPPPVDVHTLASPPQAEYAGYEFFHMEKATDSPKLECHESICDVCRVPYDPTDEEMELEGLRDADWGDLTETHLEVIVLSNLDEIFRSAIKRIVSCGYPEEVAVNAVMRPGICHGGKDTSVNVVENALAFLRSGKEVDSSKREIFSEDLQKFEKSVLTEMVSVLREVRPFFSNGDGMWCLLISDMNVSHACAVDSDLPSVTRKVDTSYSSTVSQVDSQSNPNMSTSQNTLEFNASSLNKSSNVSPYSQTSPQTGIPAVMSVPNLPSGKFCASSNGHSIISNFNVGKDDTHCSSNCVGESICSSIPRALLTEEKRMGGRKSHVGISRRESTLRQKSIHFEKSYRAFGSKAALRTSKNGSLGKTVLDRNCKAISLSSGVNVKSASLRLSKATDRTNSPESTPLNFSLSDGPSDISLHNMETAGRPSSLPFANTELSLSIPSTNGVGINTNPNCDIEAATCSNYPGFLSAKMRGHSVPNNKKDEILLVLVSRVRELQAQATEWTEWGQQKVMQAARRLNKDKGELQNLRQEKEEVARLEKEKHNLEESTKKKLSEMEIALSKASGQVERASAASRRLDVENSVLRQEMEAAKRRAAESAASCQEVSRREIQTQRKFQSWERERALLHEEHTTEKHKFSKLERQFQQAMEFQHQLQARWKLEESMKDEVLMQVDSVRKEREHIETSGKGKENAMRLEAETNLQRYKTDIRRLEDQIAQLRLMTDSSKIAALRRGVDGSYASSLSDGRKNVEAHIAKLMERLDLETEDVQRERECVMCLTEEMSVVFLPCAHQVVCAKCNDLHEKQNMKDCPSCRTPIQQRICVRSAAS